MESELAAMEPTTGKEEDADEGRIVVVERPRRASQGKQRIDICYIQNKERRQVTFSKRRKGLFKKASELAQLCSARVAVIAERSRAFAIGAPSVNAVLHAYSGEEEGDVEKEVSSWLNQDEDDDSCRSAVEAALRQAEETKALAAAQQARMKAIGEKVALATEGRKHWWEADMQQLGPEVLPEFARALQRLRDNVQRHLYKLSAAVPLPPPGHAQ
ncbi:hypothetical protein PR202_ga12459 [Eleusine coracana subsp. coracana]|uniref:MADS-box domain-containing protein n=1 Tax=Eleusine coracana subsp. coracana TaxID=191504 RepID=A0AAV5CBN7_ELECO|nr:hypothetical protein PR202_ga12459 [Eleusine coracana subsp. coracana]